MMLCKEGYQIPVDILSQDGETQVRSRVIKIRDRYLPLYHLFIIRSFKPEGEALAAR